MPHSLTEQEIIRRESLQELIKMGLNPYPAELFLLNADSQVIRSQFEQFENKEVSIAGRILSRRIMGNASFVEIQDDRGKIQLYIKRDILCPEEDKIYYNHVFKKLIDLGDIIGVRGIVFKTQTGEISIRVLAFQLLSKSLRPLPIVKETVDEVGNKTAHDAFTDPEHRFRQRYVDLIVNPEVKRIFRTRTQVIKSMRDFLNSKEYLEVETPILQPLHGGATARPFITHHNALDIPLYLRIADELYLKRLIVGGFNGVYEFCKDFRNEGMSRFHNPEFTMMELYVAYKDYFWMMDFVEEMIEKVVFESCQSYEVMVNGLLINFKKPWKRITMYEVIKDFTGIDISGLNETELKDAAKLMNIHISPEMGKGKIIDEIFSQKCEPHLIQPTFIMDYPVEMSPLAKKHRTKPGLVERFELICNCKEICNAFSELNDPIDQRNRFEEQIELGKRGDEEAMMLDEDYLRALEYGMPPTAGLGVGIDRLTMIITNSPSIQEVILFPQMRPESDLRCNI